MDLLKPRIVNRVVLHWQGNDAYGKAYKIQVSQNGTQWTDAYAARDKTGGTDDLAFPDTEARYVRMLGQQRGTKWGYSLWEFEIYEKGKGKVDLSAYRDLSNVHFIKLLLKDRDGRILSDNFYWRARSFWKYEDLGKMKTVAVTGSVNMHRDGDACTLTAELRNPGKGVALMIRLKLVDAKTSLLVAPIRYSDNYFSLLPGGTKAVTIDFEASHVPGGAAALRVEGWNVVPAPLAQFPLGR